MQPIAKIKKEVYSVWENFSVISDAEWRRYKRKNKNNTILSRYQLSDCRLLKNLNNNLDKEQ